MIKYSQLKYTVPPRCHGLTREVAFAVTPHEVVRRTTEYSGRVTYEVADLTEMWGQFVPHVRVPAVRREAWTPVAGSALTPAERSICVSC